MVFGLWTRVYDVLLDFFTFEYTDMKSSFVAKTFLFTNLKNKIWKLKINDTSVTTMSLLTQLYVYLLPICKGTVLTSATMPWHGLIFLPPKFALNCKNESENKEITSKFFSTIKICHFSGGSTTVLTPKNPGFKKPQSLGSGTGCLYHRSASLPIWPVNDI